MKKKKQQMLGNLEIAAFCDQLSMIVSAGIPIYEGISILQEDDRKKKRRNFICYQQFPRSWKFFL